MLANLKTKTLAAFGVIVILSLVISSVLIVNTGKVADYTQRFYQEPYKGVDAVWTLRRDFLDNQRALYKFLSVSEENKEKAYTSLQKSLDENNRQIRDTLAGLKVINADKGESVAGMLSSLDGLQTQEEALQGEIMQMILSGDKSQAAQVLRNSYEPVFEEVSAQVLQMFKAAETDAVSFVNNAQSGKRNAVVFGIILSIVLLVVCVVSIVLYVRAIIFPLREVAGVAREMAAGNLSVADQITYNCDDEIGILANCQREMAKKMAQYISTISKSVHSLAKKDLRINRVKNFEGDFLSIQSSVRELIDMLNATMGEINTAAIQVETGASQVASAAQGLSQGTTEQAASIETLVSAINKISAQVRDTYDNVEQATREADMSGEEIANCSSKMLEMNAAMDQITERANEIGKIIKTIEDIAFQTNILALNAAVEAARAGEAGKGFAVVADEVRNLASKSAEASKSTSALIEGTIRAVEDGSRIALDTQTALENVVASSNKVTAVVASIADASNEQAQAIGQVSDVMQQISSVVHTNSATAEESAAASEELSGQAQTLKNLVGEFKLKEAELSSFASSQGRQDTAVHENIGREISKTEHKQQFETAKY